jgi:hypothetical protein
LIIGDLLTCQVVKGSSTRSHKEDEMIKFYRKDDGSLTIKEYEAQFAPHEVIDEEISGCPVCGLTWRPDYDDPPCLCKDVVDFDGDVDYNANEVFNLLQPLIAGAYELGLNPLPVLRKLLGDNAKISYWNEDCFGAMRNCPMSEVISGKVTVLVSKDGWCRFW